MDQRAKRAFCRQEAIAPLFLAMTAVEEDRKDGPAVIAGLGRRAQPSIAHRL